MTANKKPKTDKTKIYSKIYVCTNFRTGMHSSCAARGSKKLLKQLQDLAERHPEEVIVEQIVCMGKCEKGPNIRIAGGEILNGVSSTDLPGIIDRVISGASDKLSD